MMVLEELLPAVQSNLTRRLEQLKRDIAQSISAHGLTASGKTANSMYVTSTQFGVALYGRPFFPALETGSSAWTGATGIRCSYEEFKGIILNWARAKGLNFGQNKAYEKAVANIAWSIMQNGTAQKHKGRLDVYTSLVDEAAEECEKVVMDEVNVVVNNVIANWGEK